MKLKHNLAVQDNDDEERKDEDDDGNKTEVRFPDYWGPGREVAHTFWLRQF